jgi:hypothetical protein
MLRSMRSSGAAWFRCFAEVPGVGYPGDPQRRSSLPARGLVPEVVEFSAGGHPRTALSWPSAEGWNSASPAHGLAFTDARGETGQQTRERVLNALESPGELLDYHFAIQGAAEALYKRRNAEPAWLELVEWLTWYDVKLVEAHEVVFRVTPETREYLSVFAFDFLVRLHQREGHLREALALATRFAPFRGNDGSLKELRERVAVLESEHA